MKDLSNQKLLALFCASLMAAAAVFLAADRLSLDAPHWLIQFTRGMALLCPAVPAFFLQLLLCRIDPGLGLAALAAPLGLMALFSGMAAKDALGAAVLFRLSAAPAVGCAAAWCIYLFRRRKRMDKERKGGENA